MRQMKKLNNLTAVHIAIFNEFKLLMLCYAQSLDKPDSPYHISCKKKIRYKLSRNPWIKELLINLINN
jgi:hypothetical protein